MKKDYLRSFCALLLVLIMAVSLAACNNASGGSTDKTGYEIALDKTELTLAEDSVAELTATVQPACQVKWSSSDDTIVSVSGGTLLAKKPGNVTVTATAGEATATCQVTVTSGDGSFLYLESREAFYPLEIGGEAVQVGFTLYQVAADGTKTEVTDASVSYTLQNDKIAKLEGDKLTGLVGGVTAVTASCDGYSASAEVRIYDMFVSNTEEWREMLSSRTVGSYYMLDSDIDFTGKSYTGMNTGAPASNRAQSFRGTLDGNGHTVKNVRLEGSGYVSLFGQLYSAKIRNIAFENVQIASSNGSGLATSISGSNTVVENVLLDLHFTGGGYALFRTAYGGTLQNVVAIVSSNGNIGSIGSVGGLQTSAVYVLAEGGINAIDQVHSYTSKMEMVADVNGQKLLPASYWNYFGGTELPALIGN